MDRKTIVTILLAALLALVASFLILKKESKISIDTEPAQKQEAMNLEETQTSDEALETEDLFNEEEKREELKPLSKVHSEQPTHKNNDKSQATKEKTPVFDQIVVQEGTITKEAEKDYGIKKVGENAFEITREFNFKSPKKYSFKGYGILDEVSSK